MAQAAEVDNNDDNGLHHTRSEPQIRELCYPSPLFLPAPIVIGPDSCLACEAYFTFYRWKQASSAFVALTFTQISLFNTIFAIGRLRITLLLVPAYFLHLWLNIAC